MTTPLPIGLRRLMKLAEHLESGTLGHRVFKNGIINADRYGLWPGKPVCGHFGNALGELPILFRRQWKFNFTGCPRLRIKSSYESLLIDSASFFRVSISDAIHLFVCSSKSLPTTATRKQVARHIRRFVEGKAGK